MTVLPYAAASALTVLLINVAMPPHHAGVLHWIAWVPVLLVAMREGRAARATAALTPFAVYMVLGSWLTGAIVEYAEFSHVAAMGMTVAVMGATAAPYSLAMVMVPHLRRVFGGRWPLAWAALWVIAEWTADQTALFPSTLAISQLQVGPVIQLVAFTGVAGVSFLLALVNGVVAEALLRQMEGRPQAKTFSILCAVVLLVGLGLGNQRVASVERALAEGTVLRVGQIQSDFTTRVMLEDPKGAEAYWYDASETFVPGSIDLLIWPEGAAHLSLGRPGEPMMGTRRAITLADRLGAELIVGTSSIKRDFSKPAAKGGVLNFNSATLVRDHKVADIHDKAMPMPFSEYLPFEDLLPRTIREFALQYTGRFTKVDTFRPLEGKELSYGVGLCYELFSSGHMRRVADSDVLVALANDSWYGDTRAPHLSAATGALRAIELGRPLIRNGYSGVSQVVEPHGQIAHRLEPFQRSARVVDVRLAQVPTLFAAWGDWFVGFCGLGLFGGWALVVAARRRSPVVAAEVGALPAFA